jgi:Resolvase, N terminal domain
MLANVMRERSPGDTLAVTRLDRFARSTRDLLNLSTTGSKASVVAGASVANHFAHDRVCAASRGRFLSKFIRQ